MRKRGRNTYRVSDGHADCDAHTDTSRGADANRNPDSNTNCVTYREPGLPPREVLAMANGNGWKVATILFGVLITITMAWTSAISEEGKKRDKRLTVTEENVRTIHYEAQVQRELLESIAEAVGAETGPTPPVRPLRKADQ